MIFHPTRGKLFCDVLKDDNRTESGLWLAETTKQVPHRATITAISICDFDVNGKEISWILKIGDIVHFKRNWDIKKTDEKQTVFLTSDDILAYERNDKINSYNDLVLIRKHEKETSQSGMIIIPDGLAVRQNHGDFWGKVISIGHKNRMGIAVGSKVAYHRNEGLPVIFKGETLYSIKTRALLAIIKE